MSKLDIKLLADRVLVELVNQQEVRTAAGIILSSNSEEKTLVGKVLGVSSRIETCEKEEDKVYTGDNILFSKFAGSDIRYRERDYKILRITDIFATLVL